jgi:hypothetical protein
MSIKVNGPQEKIRISSIVVVDSCRGWQAIAVYKVSLCGRKSKAPTDLCSPKSGRLLLIGRKTIGICIRRRPVVRILKLTLLELYLKVCDKGEVAKVDFLNRKWSYPSDKYKGGSHIQQLYWRCHRILFM